MKLLDTKNAESFLLACREPSISGWMSLSNFQTFFDCRQKLLSTSADFYAKQGLRRHADARKCACLA